MYQPMNEQFAANTRQFADTAAHINRLALQNAEHLFGLQMNTLQDNANAAFGFFAKMVEVRDFNALRDVMPAGVQVARENLQRVVAAGQDAYEATLKTNESIGQIARGQFETARGQFEQATRTATAAAKDAVAQTTADVRAQAEQAARAADEAANTATNGNNNGQQKK